MAIFLNKHITVSKFQTSKQLQSRGDFLSRLGKMLIEGFSLKEALSFLSTVSQKGSSNWVKNLETSVLDGHSLVEGLASCQFPEQIITQLNFALYHGEFSQAVKRAGEQLIKQSQKRKKLTAVMTYPLMLILFITIMLFVMRTVLLPHIDQIADLKASALPMGTRFIVQLVYQMPVILIVAVGIGLSMLLIIRKTTQKRHPLDNLNQLCQLTKSYVIKLYWSYYFAYEWGQLLKGGCSLLEVVTIMKRADNSELVKEVGRRIEDEMLKGFTFSESLVRFNFLTTQITEVIKHGEQSGLLGAELTIYAQGCEEEFDTKIEQLMALVQPLVFAVVAVMIIAIYAALMLPTFSVLDTL